MVAPYTTNTLVQFYLLRQVNNTVIRTLDPETVETTIDRKVTRMSFPDPVQLLKKKNVKAPGLIKALGNAKLQLIDAQQQVRIGHGGATYLLVTYVFSKEQTAARARRKELEDTGMKSLAEFLDTLWKEVMISIFPNENNLCSVHFNGERETSEGVAVIPDADAATFGLVVHNMQSKTKTAG